MKTRKRKAPIVSSQGSLSAQNYSNFSNCFEFDEFLDNAANAGVEERLTSAAETVTENHQSTVMTTFFKKSTQKHLVHFFLFHKSFFNSCFLHADPQCQGHSVFHIRIRYDEINFSESGSSKVHHRHGSVSSMCSGYNGYIVTYFQDVLVRIQKIPGYSGSYQCNLYNKVN